jgi:RsiW-degrading membrane proteinase PrsW (M82 family)
MLAFLFVLMSGFVPVIEEIGKVLAVGALALARRPSRAQAVMWGLTCGATFSIYEAAFGNPFSTSAAMVSVGRVGALLIHCCAASLTALGLYEWISQRRARWFFLSLGLSMSLHAAWNALAIALSAAMALDAAAAGAAQVIILSALGLLSLGSAYVLARITKPQAGLAA